MGCHTGAGVYVNLHVRVHVQTRHWRVRDLVMDLIPRHEVRDFTDSPEDIQGAGQGWTIDMGSLGSTVCRSQQ